jgi:alkaline phosphatase
MRRTTITIFSILVLFAFTGVQSCKSPNKEHNAKYVFYFIGDGMGYQQITTTQAYLAAVNGEDGNANLSFTDFPVVGLAETYAHNRYITGSAAAGTALSTGFKTSVNTLGLNHNHSDTLYSIAYFAKKKGFDIGIATSVSIDHATPAAFYAHQKSRSNYHGIGHDLLKSGYRFYASGGLKDPNGKNSEYSMGDVIAIGKDNGYYFSESLTVSDSILDNYSSIVFSSPNPSNGNSLKYHIDNGTEDVTLADITRMGTNLLDESKGFFFMIEGGKIDWACHDNDAATTIIDMLAFSEAINVALEFYNKYPQETLIIVTADHETGGMTMGNAKLGYDSNISLLSKQKHSMDELNIRVKEFKKQYNGKPTFDQTLKFLASDNIMGLTKEILSNDQLSDLRMAYNASIAPLTEQQRKLNRQKYGSNDPIAVVSIRVLNQLAGIGWTSFSHTGSHVPVYAKGAGQELFSGQMDNTDIPKRIAKAMGLKIEQFE